MTCSLLDISQKIESSKAMVLAAMDRTARKRGVTFFVVGAAARDFILQNGYNIRPPRATLDVDFGVNVSSWDEFTMVVESLLSDEHFTKTNTEYRFESPIPHKTLVDILPFGAIENVSRAIQWRQQDCEMNMMGFSEAYRAAIDVRITTSPSLIVKIVSLAGLALLKLLSWNDKPYERDRDAKDFSLIMHQYLDTKPADYVFDVHEDLAALGDYDLIAARSLGRDMKTIAGSSVFPTLTKILKRECEQTGNLRFVQQMQSTAIDRENSISRDIVLLTAVLMGVEDR